MTWRSPKFFIVAAIAVMCAGVGLKVLRYSAAPKRVNIAIENRVNNLLDQHGWKIQPTDPNSSNDTVRITTFKKAECPHLIRVSNVGTTGGLESYLRQKFGDDLAFVQHGTVLDHPDMLRFKFVTTWRRVKARILGNEWEQRPILVIIPAPRKKSDICSGPPNFQWRKL